jgi:hypothetical protein
VSCRIDTAVHIAAHDTAGRIDVSANSAASHAAASIDIATHIATCNTTTGFDVAADRAAVNVAGNLQAVDDTLNHVNFDPTLQYGLLPDAIYFNFPSLSDLDATATERATVNHEPGHDVSFRRPPIDLVATMSGPLLFIAAEADGNQTQTCQERDPKHCPSHAPARIA